MRVYPRVYGGTLQRIMELPNLTGLSPRVRGNPIVDSIVLLRPGSIPACTGEPGSYRLRIERHGVYPRVYGGTVILVPGVYPRCTGEPHD